MFSNNKKNVIEKDIYNYSPYNESQLPEKSTADNCDGIFSDWYDFYKGIVKDDKITLNDIGNAIVDKLFELIDYKIDSIEKQKINDIINLNDDFRLGVRQLEDNFISKYHDKDKLYYLLSEYFKQKIHKN